MSESTVTRCARHPGTDTRLSCSECGTAICPRCSVATPVGQRCPDCARLPRSATRQGRPRQYLGAVGAGLAATAVAATLLPLLWTVPLLRLFAAYGIGIGVALAVRWGAGGNASPPFRRIALGLAVLAVAGATTWVGGGPGALPGALLGGSAWTLVSYGVAALGAWQRF